MNNIVKALVLLSCTPSRPNFDDYTLNDLEEMLHPHRLGVTHTKVPHCHQAFAWEQPTVVESESLSMA